MADIKALQYFGARKENRVSSKEQYICFVRRELQYRRIGDNVRLASHVLLVTHDVSHFVLNNLGLKNIEGKRYKERIGCIDIGSNVFVGTNTTILYDVKIGNNVIIGAGSLVNHDIPSNSVAAGVPARVICTFDEFVEKRKNDTTYPDGIATQNQHISEELVAWCWKQFEKRRGNPSKNGAEER